MRGGVVDDVRKDLPFVLERSYPEGIGGASRSHGGGPGRERVVWKEQTGVDGEGGNTRLHLEGHKVEGFRTRYY